MEPRFGHDFSEVRVHTDAQAADSAKRLGANAYARGQALVFAAGRYDPNSVDGRRLIAHELTHVVQQGTAPETRARRQPVTRGAFGVVQRDARCRPAVETGKPEGDEITGFMAGDPAALSDKGWAEVRAVLPKLRSRADGTELRVHGFGTLACSRAWGIKFQVLRPSGVRDDAKNPITIVEHGPLELGPDAAENQRVIISVAPSSGAAAGSAEPKIQGQTPWGNLVDASGRPKPGVERWLREGTSNPKRPSPALMTTRRLTFCKDHRVSSGCDTATAPRSSSSSPN
jgi:hypothetical protein